MNDTTKATRREVVRAILTVLEDRRARPLVDDFRGKVYDFRGIKGRYRILKRAGEPPVLLRIGKPGKIAVEETEEVLLTVSKIDKLHELGLGTLAPEPAPAVQENPVPEKITP